MDASVTETEMDTKVAVKVQLSKVPKSRATVDYTTADGTATAPGDYTAKSGTLVFRAGTRAKYVKIAVAGDAADEADETFNLKLSNPSGARIADRIGVITIVDNETTPTLSTSDLEVTEGNSGSQNVNLPVTLSAASGREVTVNYVVTPGTATYGGDYNLTPTTGTLAFSAGDTAKAVTLSVNGDTVDETNETVNIVLVAPVNATLGTSSAVLKIKDDDGPGISVNDANGAPSGLVGEGSTATFTVTLGAASPDSVTVSYATSNGTALAPADYTAKSGTLTFAPGETSKTVPIVTVSDAVDEANETFFLNLTNAGNATLADGQGLALIDDNDGPLVSIGDAAAPMEGASATFTVTLAAPSPQLITVNYATQNGSAAAPGDYTAKSGTVMFAPGDVSEPIVVSTVNDAVVEEDESFSVVLSSPVDATVNDNSGVTWINGNGVGAKATSLDNVWGDAATVPPTVKGSSIWPLDTDMYSIWGIDGPTGGNLSVTFDLTMSAAGGNLDLAVYTQGGNPIGSSTHSGTTPETVTVSWADTGGVDNRAFYVEVKGYGAATNSYSLSIHH